ncbi:MAG TPA: NAD(P)-dependent oxidoreductase [Candidatus Saccharimonadales bacterium]|nr:NAD(P)-dependent oxidoreductase [Candidatus Saccharimonadales bacterium]
MEGKRVVFFEVEPWEQDFLRDKLEHHAELSFFSHRLTFDNVHEAENANYIAAFIYSDFSQTVLDKLPHLKGLATMSVGCDHIDLPEAARRKIIVSNVPNYGPNTVAEQTMALLLALSRNIVPSVERTRHGEYDYTGLSGWDLNGKTIGVVGTGKIGALVAQAAKGLGMKVVGYDPKPNPAVAQKTGLEYMPLPELLKQSDVITLHVPLCDETKHMLSTEQFKQMKKGAVLINTARGGLVDINALIEALDNGTVAQAGLDVLEDENILKEERQLFSKYFNLHDYQTAMADHVLMRDPRVIVTPHNAFNSKESLHNILQTTVDNIVGMMTGDATNIVNQ